MIELNGLTKRYGPNGAGRALAAGIIALHRRDP